MSDLTAYKQLTGYRKPCTTVYADDYEMTVQLDKAEKRRNMRLFTEKLEKMTVEDFVPTRSHTPPTK